MRLTSGASLGPYEIVSPLGAGGMGEVYRARDTKRDREVAIKILPELFAADPERVAQSLFQAEARRGLRSPYDVTADGQHFLVNRLPSSTDVPPFTVVVNWQEELKQRVPTR